MVSAGTEGSHRSFKKLIMANRDKEARPRKVMVLEPNQVEWNTDDMLDDLTWAPLRNHLPRISQEADTQLRTALRKCLGNYIENRVNVQQGALLAASVRHYDKLEKDLRRAEMTWKKIQDGPSSIPMPFDGLAAMVEAARRMAAGLRARKIKTEPVERPFQEFVRCVADCLRDAKLDPTVNGRGYDATSNAPSWFQDFMIALNDALPILLHEPAVNDRALAKRIMRALQKTK